MGKLDDLFDQAEGKTTLDTLFDHAEATPDFLQPHPIPGIPGMGGEDIQPSTRPLMPALMPGQVAQPQYAPDRSGRIDSYVPVRESDPAPAIGGAIGGILGFAAGGPVGAAIGAASGSGLTTRLAGAAIPSKYTRGTDDAGNTKGFTEALNDPETGIMRAPREGIAKSIKTAWEYATDEEKPYLMRSLAALMGETAAAAYLGAATVEDPALGGPMLASIASRVVPTGKIIPGVKRYVSDLSQINPELLEKAATPEGMDAIRQASQISPADLGQQIAEDAQAVNKYRDELASGSRATQERQIQEINDAAALENQGINAQAMEENQALNAQRENLAEESRALQSRQVEGDLLAARESATGAQASSLSDIQPGAIGEDINATVTQAKKPMQDAWVLGDRSSVGPVRNAPAATVIKRTADGTFRKKKALTQELASVLGEFKALSPKQGMRKISSGAAGAIDHLIGLSEQSGHTIDDLLNIRAELRRIRTGDNFKGNIFDNSTDDLAFGRASSAIDKTINQSIAKAAPKEAKTMIALMKAKDQQYGIAKDMLGEVAGTLGATKNTANIIGKVSAMGPLKARAFIQAAKGNPALAPVVPKLRQAFVDDLLLSSMESGQFSAAKMAKRWHDPKMQEIKRAWLSPEDIKRIDAAIELGGSKIENPSIIPAPKKVPIPAKVGSAADRGEGFYSNVARSEIKDPEHVGRSFNFAGKPDKETAAVRVKNIGNDAATNKRAMAELKTLDALNGTDYATKAEKVFEAIQLGVDDAGRLSSVPRSSTGRSGLGAHMGEIAGFFIGGPAGFIAGHGLGAVAGSAAGATLGRGIQGGIMYAQSPAGAVAAYRVMNKLLSARFPRAAKLGAAIQKAGNSSARVRLVAALTSELDSQASTAPFQKVAESDHSENQRRVAALSKAKGDR